MSVDAHRRGLLNGLCDVPGVRVGHSTDVEGLTGCTAVLFDGPAVVGADIRGSAPGTRETDRLAPTASVRDTHALLLTGGSAFGLAAADGVMRLLEERGRGLDVGVARIPLVSAAVLFDLMLGSPDARPGPEMGYEAAVSASAKSKDRGSVGAGTGATVGKVLGMERAMKGGVGGASVVLQSGVTVAALAAVNAFGGVYEPGPGRVIAGPRLRDGTPADTLELLEDASHRARWDDSRGENTTLAVVATDARLTKTETTKVASMSHDGLARSIQPVHTTVDGDAIFAVSTGERETTTDVAGAWAAWAVQEAILDAVKSASGAGGVPGLAG